jgi:hypothetical protein
MMKASELQKLLGDVDGAGDILARRIADGTLENDLGTQPIFKSDAVASLYADLAAAIDRLGKVPEAAPARANDRAQRLAKSAAAENAPEVVGAVTDMAAAIDNVEKATIENAAALAKGIVKLAEAATTSLKGLVEMAARFGSLEDKVNELHKGFSSTAVAPAGVAAVVAPTPLDASPAAAAAKSGEFDIEKYQVEFERATSLIKGAMQKLTPAEQTGAPGARLAAASTALTFGHKTPADVLVELGLQ